MKFLLGLFTLLLISSVSSFAQDTTVLKRTPYKLRIAVDKKNFYVEQINATPYILPDNILQIYPGESVFIEIEQSEGTIKSMIAVTTIRDSSKTISVSLTQVLKGKKHEFTMLAIHNPLHYKLIYKAAIFNLSAKTWTPTHVVPVYTLLIGYETWPDVITSAALGNWKLEAE